MRIPIGWAQQVKNVREQRGLTQEELAARVGITRVGLSNIERGTTKTVRARTWEAIMRELDITGPAVRETLKNYEEAWEETKKQIEFLQWTIDEGFMRPERALLQARFFIVVTTEMLGKGYTFRDVQERLQDLHVSKESLRKAKERSETAQEN